MRNQIPHPTVPLKGRTMKLKTNRERKAWTRGYMAATAAIAAGVRYDEDGYGEEADERYAALKKEHDLQLALNEDLTFRLIKVKGDLERCKETIDRQNDPSLSAADFTKHEEEEMLNRT